MPYDSSNEAAALARGFSVEQLKRIQRQQGLSNKTLSALSEGGHRTVLTRLDNPDRPRARQAHYRLQLVDETGTIPPNALNTALKQLDSARSRGFVSAAVAGVPCGRQVDTPRSLIPGVPVLDPTAGLSPAQSGWTSLGPGNIGGRTRAIVVHPGNAAIIWACSVGGGIWRSDNGGGLWEPVDDLMANLAVSCMIMDPDDSDILYAGTGEGFSNVDALRGGGVFQTLDGIHWTQLPTTATADFHYVNRLAISRNSRVLLAATENGLFRSDDALRTDWTQVLSGAAVADVRFHPGDSRKAVAGGTRNGTAYYSNNGGRTWHEASHPAGPWSGRVELAYAVADPHIVYASVQMNSGQIWRSEDGGRTYARRNSSNENGVAANYLGQQGWYDNVIWAGKPDDADFLLLGGIDLWKSADGGNNLEQISNWRLNHSVHADHHVIVAHPDFDGTNNKTVFFGNDGGIYRTDDVFTAGDDVGWVNLVNNYAVTKFYGGAGNPATGTIVGGAQDNGTLSFSPQQGREWREIFGGDGGYVAADPDNPDIWYGEYVNLQIFRNTNGASSGANWWETYICGRFFNNMTNNWDWKPEPFQIPDARLRQALFIAPFILDPNNSDRMLAGGAALWRSNNVKAPNTDSSGPEWTLIKDSIGGFAYISAIAVARGDSDLVWVGHRSGEVFRSRNATADEPIWQRIDHAGTNPLTVRRFCTHIAVDPGDHNIVYVTFGGYADNNIWKTVDGGTNWHGIGNALPDAPVRSLVIHPRRREFLYAGTEVGVFASENAGATWSPTNEGPTNCSVDDLFWMAETLISVTHGRGMFQIDLSGV